MKDGRSALSALMLVIILSFLSFACQARESSAASGSKVTSSGPTAAKLAWTTFEDPFEKAFIVDVPQGWTVKGGLFRMGYSDQRPMVELTSPDGQISIRLGDVSVPVYAVPVQFHQRQGEIYDLGAQAQMVIEKYRSGPEFAVLYSQARFAKACRNPQTEPAGSDLSVPDYVPLDAAPKQSSAGQVAYRCETNDGPRVAAAYTKTMLAGGIWVVPEIASFIAAPGQVSRAQSIIRHAAESFRVNPEWMEYQKRMDAEGLAYQRARQQRRLNELQAQVQQFESKMHAMQSQVNAFERHQAQQASQVEGFTNALIGVTPTTDPLTGENRTVWTGPKDNYWVNGLGQVVNATNAPGAGWRQLQTN